MKRGGLVALTAVVVLAQMSLLPAVRPLGVVPNAALVLVVLLGLETTASTAVVAAVAGGLVLDLASGANFGLWMGTLVLAALAGALTARAGVELAGSLVAVGLVIIGTVVMAAVALVGVAGSVTHWPWGTLAVGLGVQVILNLILTVAGWPLVHWLAPAPTGRSEEGA